MGHVRLELALVLSSPISPLSVSPFDFSLPILISPLPPSPVKPAEPLSPLPGTPLIDDEEVTGPKSKLKKTDNGEIGDEECNMFRDIGRLSNCLVRSETSGDITVEEGTVLVFNPCKTNFEGRDRLSLDSVQSESSKGGNFGENETFSEKDGENIPFSKTATKVNRKKDNKSHCENQMKTTNSEINDIPYTASHKKIPVSKKTLQQLVLHGLNLPY
jgi:hypothetical protein